MRNQLFVCPVLLEFLNKLGLHYIYIILKIYGRYISAHVLRLTGDFKIVHWILVYGLAITKFNLFGKAFSVVNNILHHLLTAWYVFQGTLNRIFVSVSASQYIREKSGISTKLLSDQLYWSGLRMFS